MKSHHNPRYVVNVLIMNMYNFEGDVPLMCAFLLESWRLPLSDAALLAQEWGQIPASVLKKEQFANQVLANDEILSDLELADLFIKHGLSQAEAVTALKYRPQCLVNILHSEPYCWAKIQERTDDFTVTLNTGIKTA